jgi:hypothetical protein
MGNSGTLERTASHCHYTSYSPSDPEFQIQSASGSIPVFLSSKYKLGKEDWVTEAARGCTEGTEPEVCFYSVALGASSDCPR